MMLFDRFPHGTADCNCDRVINPRPGKKNAAVSGKGPASSPSSRAAKQKAGAKGGRASAGAGSKKAKKGS